LDYLDPRSESYLYDANQFTNSVVQSGVMLFCIDTGYFECG
jgi:hypothetical protein